MASNGKRRPPRPRIELVTAAASDSEAAAIVAAVEQFIADTAPSPPRRAPQSGWLRAALREGVSAKDLAAPQRTGAQPWGSR